MTNKKFIKFIKSELGWFEADKKTLLKLKKKLGWYNCHKLKQGKYRLLSYDNFVDCYGENSKLFIKNIDCEGVFDIVLYRAGGKHNESLR